MQRFLPVPVVPLLGAAGLLAAGPLVSTLLVGRTGAVPSLRWIGLALAVWVTLGAAAWAVAGQRRAAQALAPLAALSPFLPWSYADDRAFHALSRGAAQLLGTLGLLALVGLAYQRFGRTTPGGDGADVEPVERAGARSPALVAPIAGMALMFGLNDVLFEPLGRQGAGPLAPVLFFAGVVPAALLALTLALRLVDWRGAAAIASTTALCVAMTVWLGVPAASAAPFAAGALCLVPAARNELWRTIPARAKPWVVLALVTGFALASTNMTMYGLAARELHTAPPVIAALLPALGLLCLSSTLTLASGWPASGLAERRDGWDA